jgi:hypothetical protein
MRARTFKGHERTSKLQRSLDDQSSSCGGTVDGTLIMTEIFSRGRNPDLTIAINGARLKQAMVYRHGVTFSGLTL